MPGTTGLIGTDPIVSHSFFLELDGSPIAVLSGVSGLDIELEVVTTTQVGPKGQRQTIKTLGGQNKAPDLTLTRMAPIDAKNDKLWQWFDQVRDKGIKANDRANGRKNGSIVIYDTTNAEISRFNFYAAWPTKISTDALTADGNEFVKETITIVCEKLERIK
jgi:phage tail-like protein